MPLAFLENYGAGVIEPALCDLAKTSPRSYRTSYALPSATAIFAV